MSLFRKHSLVYNSVVCSTVLKYFKVPKLKKQKEGCRELIDSWINFWSFFSKTAHYVALLCAAQALVLARHVDVGGGEVPELWKQPWFAGTGL